MEENKKDKLSEIDKLLRETSFENRLKFDATEPSKADSAADREEDIDAILGDIDSSKFVYEEEAQEEIAPKKPQKKIVSKKSLPQEDIKAVLGNPEPEVVPEADEVKKEEPVKEERAAQKEEVKKEPVRIIDETNTTIELSEGVDFYEEPVLQNQKKQKKPKQKVKLSVGQIILISVIGVALLWCVFFTTDHTLASFGLTPIFCREVKTYEDGSASFKGLGYKIQFSFDSENNLTQKCVPFWEDGPNDLIDKGASVGASFE